jgi:hypothetical protein
VQTYAAAAGTNHRSFWTLDFVPDEVITGIAPLASPEGVHTASQAYDLQGRPWHESGKGIRVKGGKKYLERGE